MYSDNTLNSIVLFRYLRVLNLYTEKPKLFEKVKQKFVVKNLIKSSTKDEKIEGKNKDELLNDFMKLTQENMEQDLFENNQGNQQYTEPLNESNFVFNDVDDEQEIIDYQDE